MYTTINFKTKAELKRAIASGERVTVYQRNVILTGALPPRNGMVYLEEPHFPQPHRWYAEGLLKDGVLVKVK